MSWISNDSEPGDSEYGAGVGLEQRGDALADQRVVIGRGDAVAREHAVAELARRLIGAVGDQQVITRVERREQGGRDRSETRRHQRNAGAVGPFERAQRVLERLRRRGAAATVE